MSGGHAKFTQDKTSADLIIYRPMREAYLEQMVVAAIKGALLRLNELPTQGDIIVHIELQEKKADD